MFTSPGPLIIKNLLTAIVLGLLASGCYHNQKQPVDEGAIGNVPQQFQQLDSRYWYQYGFHVAWPSGADVNWSMDLLLAHAVVAPVLRTYARDITYWRFHRRAARDARGHRFTFMVYCSQATAAAILSSFSRDELLEEAVEAGHVTELLVDDPDQPGLPHIEDTSDPTWSASLQQNWPSFIMGVSALWLGLIDDAIKELPKSPDDIHLLLDRYRAADEKVTETWMKEGQHALLHHLNALFGYRPLQIRKFITF